MERRQFLRAAAGGTASAGLFGGVAAGDTSPGTVEEVEEVEASTGETATIKTDEYGVSHIYADDVETLSFAAGYVQARDRLFQMDALRHIGYGDSAGILGPDQLSSDVQVTRDLQTEEEIQRQLEEAPDEMVRQLEAFADGVNRKKAEYEDANEMPAEFTLLVHSPDDWSPADSVAIINYLIGLFGVGGGGELGNARSLLEMVDSLGDRRAAYEAYEDLNWLEVPEDHPATFSPEEFTADGGESIPGYENVPEEQWRAIEAAGDTEPWGIDRAECGFAEGLITGCHDDAVAEGAMEGFKFGSNAMVVGGEHTETGKPMMFGGPQMGYFKPPVIYECGLHGAGFDVRGVAVVGAPGVVVGRTPEFAWSVTSGRDDQVDTVAVDLHPEDRYRYEWDGEYHEMETFTVTHNTASVPELISGVTEGDWNVTEVTQEVARIREDGEVMPVIAYNEEERVAYAQRKTTRGDELLGAFLWTNLGRTDDLAEFKEQLSEFPFTFNFLYADEEDVGMVHTNKVPDRADDLDHRFPKPQSRHEWSGMQTGRDAGLELENPDQGYLVQWNNSPAVGWRAGDGEGDWGGHHRVEVLDRAIRQTIEDGPVSVGDVRDVLRYAATHDANAFASAPAMVAAARESDDGTLRAMADELEAWGESDYAWADSNDDGTYDHAGHAIWEETRKELQSALFADVLGPEAPGLEYDPPESSDPHAGDHGRPGKDVTFVEAIRGETTYDWFAGGTAPVADFSVSDPSVPPGAEVTFDGTDSADDDGSIASHDWRFGDGATASGPTAAHAYDSEGEYEVSLTVTDDEGRTDTRTRTVRVDEDATASDSGCGGEAVVSTEVGTLSGYDAEAVHYYETELSDPCGLAINLSGPDDADFDLYVTLDGREPTEFDYDRRSWQRGSDESVLLRGDDVDADTTVGVLIRSFSGSGEYELAYEEHGGDAGSLAADDGPAARNATIRRAMRSAAETLTSRFGSDDPADWNAAVHESKFQAIGVVSADRIDMVNRGSWNQVVALGEGLSGAMGVLPPANSGHITFWEKVGGFIGIKEDPERLTNQLDIYRNFEYKPLPVRPDEVDSVTGDAREISR